MTEHIKLKMQETIKLIMQQIIKNEYKAGDAGGGATISYCLGEVESFEEYKYIGVIIEEKTLADGTVINTELEDKIIVAAEFNPE